MNIFPTDLIDQALQDTGWDLRTGIDFAKQINIQGTLFEEQKCWWKLHSFENFSSKVGVLRPVRILQENQEYEVKNVENGCRPFNHDSL